MFKNVPLLKIKCGNKNAIETFTEHFFIKNYEQLLRKPALVKKQSPRSVL